MIAQLFLVVTVTTAHLCYAEPKEYFNEFNGKTYLYDCNATTKNYYDAIKYCRTKSATVFQPASRLDGAWVNDNIDNITQYYVWIGMQPSSDLPTKFLNGSDMTAQLKWWRASTTTYGCTAVTLQLGTGLYAGTLMAQECASKYHVVCEANATMKAEVDKITMLRSELQNAVGKVAELERKLSNVVEKSVWFACETKSRECSDRLDKKDALMTTLFDELKIERRRNEQLTKKLMGTL